MTLPTLPLLVSVPHAGLRVPAEVEATCALTGEEIVADSDDGAAEIYAIESDVAAFVTTDVARAVVDMNRSADDFRVDGVVKTHTSYGVPIWRRPLTSTEIADLLARYHTPYHQRLSQLSQLSQSSQSGSTARGRWYLGVDCHTMAAVGPTLARDAGTPRPWVCLGNASGTCPQEWIETLKRCFEDQSSGPVTINEPFAGGYITRSQSQHMPWLQIELSREPFMSLEGKRQMVLHALRCWCDTHA